MSDSYTFPPQSGGEMLTELAYQKGRTAVAEQVLTEFAGDETRRDFAHPDRTRKLMHDFLGDSVNPFLYDVALFHDVADRAMDKPLGKNARRALQKFTEVLSDDDIVYLNSVLGDLAVVETTAEHYRETVARRGTKLYAVINETHNKNQEVPKKMWLEQSPTAAPKQMLELVKNVNLESVLIKAVEMLDNLMKPASKEIAVFQDVFEAESFYAPLCEILGYDGLAMALRDVSARLRLEKSGNSAFVDQAQRIIEKLGTKEEISQAMTKLFGHFGTGFAMDVVVDGGSGLHNIQIGELVHAVRRSAKDGKIANEQLLRGVWRVKSVGSLAMKLFKHDGKIPVDLIGVNVIVPDRADALQYFPQMVQTLHGADEVEFVSGQRRKEPLHVRGDHAFVNGMLQAIGVDVPVDVMDLDNEEFAGETKFRVAKAMVRMAVDVTMLPIEIQVQTEADRLNSRIGNAAHVVIKAKRDSVPFDYTTLADIKARKRHLRSGRVNPRTIDRGHQFAQVYAA